MGFVDHKETYGRHVLEKAARNLLLDRCLDLGCGQGDDLAVIKAINPAAHCVGVDFGNWNTESLALRGIDTVALNIENESLPFDNESVDLIIANQVLEHTKELFWINHEVFRTLKIGGYFYLGVPNVLSLHNRILGLLGVHPTSSKILSAHVRSFSKNDTISFYKSIASNFISIDGFYGSQFYPFPKILARPIATLLPSMSFSIFFLIQKTRKYDSEFIQWLADNPVETNFFSG